MLSPKRLQTASTSHADYDTRISISISILQIILHENVTSTISNCHNWKTKNYEVNKSHKLFDINSLENDCSYLFGYSQTVCIQNVGIGFMNSKLNYLFWWLLTSVHILCQF